MTIEDYKKYILNFISSNKKKLKTLERLDIQIDDNIYVNVNFYWDKGDHKIDFIRLHMSSILNCSGCYNNIYQRFHSNIYDHVVFLKQNEKFDLQLNGCFIQIQNVILELKDNYLLMKIIL